MSTLIHFCHGTFCTQDALHVNPLDLGFLRGYGVFDFTPVYEGIPFRLDDHLIRLQYSAQQVGLTLPYSLEEIEEITLQLCEQNPDLSGGYRYILTAGPYLSDTLVDVNQPSLYILAEKRHAPLPYDQGIKVVTTRVLRTLAHVKTLQYLPAVLGMKRAKERGFDDAIYLNEREELLEGMTSNLFFVKGGCFYTDDSNQIIKGVTRASLLQLINQIEFRPITLSELPFVEEAFLTSSTKDLLPITQIDDQWIGKGKPGPLTEKLRKDFIAKRNIELLEKKSFQEEDLGSF